jgi:hypothetical protein
MPSRPRVDSLASTLAASKSAADLGNDDRLGQRVYVHVGFVAADLTGRDNRADAVLAHVAQSHGRPALPALCHFLSIPMTRKRVKPGPPLG